MLVELDDDMLSKVVADSLLESYQLVLNNNGPMFSHDHDEEKKKMKQLLKGLERSHDFYSVTPLKQRLKSEKALQELHKLDQELGLYESK
jgi:hypothetical protein